MACCLVEVLRIYAPDAPYEEDQLLAIFALITTQLRGLSVAGEPRKLDLRAVRPPIPKSFRALPRGLPLGGVGFLLFRDAGYTERAFSQQNVIDPEKNTTLVCFWLLRRGCCDQCSDACPSLPLKNVLISTCADSPCVAHTEARRIFLVVLIILRPTAPNLDKKNVLPFILFFFHSLFFRFQKKKSLRLCQLEQELTHHLIQSLVHVKSCVILVFLTNDGVPGGLEQLIEMFEVLLTSVRETHSQVRTR